MALLAGFPNGIMLLAGFPNGITLLADFPNGIMLLAGFPNGITLLAGFPNGITLLAGFPNGIMLLAGFSSLLLDDQMRILQSSWGELLVAGLAWRSLGGRQRLFFAPRLLMDDSSARDCRAGEMYSQVGRGVFPAYFLVKLSRRYECNFMLL